MLIGPWNTLLDTAMFPTGDLTWTVNKKYTSAANRNIMPDRWLRKGTNDFSTLIAQGTAGTVFVWLNLQPEFFVPVMKSEAGDTISFYFE